MNQENFLILKNSLYEISIMTIQIIISNKKFETVKHGLLALSFEFVVIKVDFIINEVGVHYF